MSRDQRAYIRMLERRIEELERIVIESGLRRGRDMTRPPRFLDVQLTEAIAADSSGSGVILDFNVDSDAEVETAETITVFNPWNVEFPDDVRVIVIERINQPAERRWHILGGECAADEA